MRLEPEVAFVSVAERSWEVPRPLPLSWWAGAAYADDSPPEVGRFIRGSIRATTRDDRTVSVAIRDAVHQVDDVRQVIAKDFPASWEFRSGDWVGVDLDALQVFPYLLAPVVNSAGQLVHIMPNDDHKRDRTVVRAERTVDGE